MTGALCNEPGEKGILTNVGVTMRCDVYYIPILISSASKRGGDRRVRDGNKRGRLGILE